ncbi:MAG: hypothetical protein ACREJD_14705 [Phycisphaerales bacterium]
MANVKTMENGEVRKLIKWRTGARKGTNPVWRKKWVIVPPVKGKSEKKAAVVAKVAPKPLKKTA